MFMYDLVLPSSLCRKRPVFIIKEAKDKKKKIYVTSLKLFLNSEYFSVFLSSVIVLFLNNFLCLGFLEYTTLSVYP